MVEAANELFLSLSKFCLTLEDWGGARAARSCHRIVEESKVVAHIHERS